MDDEVRNFQVTMAQEFGAESFVESWMKHTEYDGTFEPVMQFYAIINTNIQVFPVVKSIKKEFPPSIENKLDGPNKLMSDDTEDWVITQKIGL